MENELIEDDGIINPENKGEVIDVKGYSIYENDYYTVIKYIKSGSKLMAVKFAKDKMGLDLREAKDWVDSLDISSLRLNADMIDNLLKFLANKFISTGEQWIYCEDNKIKTPEEVRELFIDKY